jgi:adenosylcobinamide-phosphate synthase
VEVALILTLAVLLDWVLGEPPRYLHPVVAMGKVAAALEGLAPRRGRVAPLLYGAAATLLLAALFSVSAYLLLAWLRAWHSVAYIIAAALLLKSTFSLRLLLSEALKIRDRLRRGQVAEARQELRALVSRDTHDLSPAMVTSAAVESAAENAADSFVSPLFFFLLLGVPGAVAYRVVNTLDAMWGYYGRYEYLGRSAARLDDLLNLVPARLSALLLAAAAPLTGGSARSALRVLWRDRSRTASPNAGWPMSAAAGALGVRLEKPGHYSLGDNHHPLAPETIDGAVRLVRVAALLWVLMAVAALGVRFALDT